ncbi:hypothetical protein SS1G_09168 [Sclerotinia sclerotiorum 1980 UF-70]|uniref:Uncharacterized protein n=2 Tax=Sclerotinia sclerotiorum (strain ATCC 18683 / 1980 / Ss-1) TaxID=665079 RepID=A0A1D9QLX8_SCLS1|nr:hypothetical protein SS1G_09168 [Sclerotinia sclerotiorum 1980 UF-70]APA15936.1 hypothetical protein sscle_15g107060 [Sclerotinia sclerotiorum 1980 UF-70]EDN93302.1 hypothetical protein SS1G_09168 [Sclerotinia sclerotiorum 1980 UF-70]
MSCTGPADTVFPVAILGTNPSYINACTAGNITSNSDAVNAMTRCCGSAPVTVLMDGCYSSCNVTGSTDQQNWEKCFAASTGINGVDFGCTLDDISGSAIPGSGTIYPSSTESAASSTVATFTTTATGSAASHSSTSASGTSKSSASTSDKTSASATSSGATASASANAGQPTVKQLSKGAVAILALAFVGLLA